MHASPTTDRDFALCDLIVRSLYWCDEVRPALHLLKSGDNTLPKGPFYPRRTELNLHEAITAAARLARQDQATPAEQLVASYLKDMIKKHRQPCGRSSSLVNGAAMKLAGMFRVNAADLISINNALLAASAKTNSSLLGARVTLAHVVLEAVRSTPRLACGQLCRWGALPD
jgi:hypothetical protein